MSKEIIEAAGTKIIGGSLTLSAVDDTFDLELNNNNPQEDEYNTMICAMSFDPNHHSYFEIEGVQSPEDLLNKVGNLTVPEVADLLNFNYKEE